MKSFQVLRAGLRLLTSDQIEKINAYTFQLLGEVGLWIQREEALDILGSAGCDILEVKRVKIPRRLVLEAIEAAPKEIPVFNRNGHQTMTLKTNSCYYGTGSDCPHTIDFETVGAELLNINNIGSIASGKLADRKFMGPFLKSGGRP